MSWNNSRATKLSLKNLSNRARMNERNVKTAWKTCSYPLEDVGSIKESIHTHALTLLFHLFLCMSLTTTANLILSNSLRHRGRTFSAVSRCCTNTSMPEALQIPTSPSFPQGLHHCSACSASPGFALFEDWSSVKQPNETCNPQSPRLFMDLH